MSAAHLDGEGEALLPPLSALFVVYFDKKRGNTIGWYRSISTLKEEGVLEYKAIPSGLHTVERDIVYFIHQGYAGLSAFENVPASEAERSASFVAVGALTELGGSRLGKIWLHASRLKDIADRLRQDVNATSSFTSIFSNAQEGTSVVARTLLENYWERHKKEEDPQMESSQAQKESYSRSVSQRRKRGLSEPLNIHVPSDNHPARAIGLLVHNFGPLLFPLYRAALLRKRILIIAQPPLQQLCNLVYALSVLGSIPSLVAEHMPGSSDDLMPMFTIGIYDIPVLQSMAELRIANESPRSMKSGYIGCTSDQVLAVKNDLYDIKIDLSTSPQGSSEAQQSWPSISTSSGAQILATQRDLRRYKLLRQGLDDNFLPESVEAPDERDDETDTRPLLAETPWKKDVVVDNEQTITEPTPWISIAYDSFLWWASAGERSAESEQEQELDNNLLASALHPRAGPESPMTMRRAPSNLAGGEQDSEAYEMAVVAYFREMTTQILTILGDAVAGFDSITDSRNGDDPSTTSAACVTKYDVLRMGLDPRSDADHEFIHDLVLRYFQKEVEVETSGVECCGVRIL
ncbi:MAG: hypothetical protein M1831_000525 [Alyxoria varia]|nr:MAG: hypothetical protein M1831_000525 [Alyxoria varia]